jgi:hypothetical protein
VPGGWFNSAPGLYSFAAGFRAKANHSGAFVWADSSVSADFASTNVNQFAVRAAGGTLIFSNPEATVGVHLASGASAWSVLSDRNLKDNFTSVDGKEIVRRLSRVPLSTWNLTSQDPLIRHLGPMAQDFYAAFGLGEDERHISTLDADGVALAAIQGLYQMVQEKEESIVTLESQLMAMTAEKAAQQERIADLESRFAVLERAMAVTSASVR